MEIFNAEEKFIVNNDGTISYNLNYWNKFITDILRTNSFCSNVAYSNALLMRVLCVPIAERATNYLSFYSEIRDTLKNYTRNLVFNIYSYFPYFLNGRSFVSLTERKCMGSASYCIICSYEKITALSNAEFLIDNELISNNTDNYWG